MIPFFILGSMAWACACGWLYQLVQNQHLIARNKELEDFKSEFDALW